MNIGDMIDDSPPAAQRSRLFDFTFNLGHVFIIISFLFSGGMFFADKQTHSAVEDTKIEQIYSANLPIRMQVQETRTDSREQADNRFQSEVNSRFDHVDERLDEIAGDIKKQPRDHK